MTDLLLLNPMASHGIYGALGDTLIAVEPPQWLRIVGGFIRDRGYSVAVLDGELERVSADEIARRVENINPRFVSIMAFGHMPSASDQQMFGARETAEAIKALNPDREIIIVGGHVSALPERTLREEPVDYAVKGEGPHTIFGLLRGDACADIPGLVWWDSDDVRINAAAPALDMEHEAHGQAWDLLPSLSRYRAHNWQSFHDPAARQPYAAIYTTLNCPYRCEFCCISAPFGKSGYQMRSPKAVVDEIEMLYRDHNVKMFKITDEMFILRPSHYLPISDLLIERGLGDKINLWCYGRVDSIKPETLSRLRAAGIRWIALGIESGNSEIRDGADKALRQNDIVGIVREIQKADIAVIGNFMFGFESDNLETMQQTLDLALECNTEFANFYTVMPYTGSRLYERALQEGLTLPPDWKSYSQHNWECRPMDTKFVSAATVLKFRDGAFDRYFTNPRYLDMVTQKFGWETRKHIEQMTTYKLKRKLLENAPV